MKSIILKFLNIPFVWNTLQNVVGANQWKLAMYPSVFTERHGKILDFGCSIGNTTAVFADFHYLGVDIDPIAIMAAKRRYAQYPNIKFHCADILKDKLPEQDYDYILFAASGHHIPDSNIRQTLDALLSYLKPGGTLRFFDIIRQPGKDGFTTRLLTRFDQGKFIRTQAEYEKLFSSYAVIDKKIFESPSNWLIKQQDFVYYAIKKD